MLISLLVDYVKLHKKLCRYRESSIWEEYILNIKCKLHCVFTSFSLPFHFLVLYLSLFNFLCKCEPFPIVFKSHNNGISNFLNSDIWNSERSWLHTLINFPAHRKCFRRIEMSPCGWWVGFFQSPTLVLITQLSRRPCFVTWRWLFAFCKFSVWIKYCIIIIIIIIIIIKIKLTVFIFWGVLCVFIIGIS
jgi:hypothetical protein